MCNISYRVIIYNSCCYFLHYAYNLLIIRCFECSRRTPWHLKGKGIPGTGQERTGDLYVRLIVTLPVGEDSELKAFAEHWRNDYDPRER